MRSTLLAVSAALFFGCAAAAVGSAATSIDHLATHHQVGVIEIDDAENPLEINAFCLDGQGRIVAACGAGPGEVRVVNDEGKILRSWRVDVKPEAIHVADDGMILVGGAGELFRFDGDGKLLRRTDSPHATELRSGSEELRKAAIDYLERRRRNPLKSRITAYENVLRQLKTREAKGDLNAAEQRMLERLPEMLERYRDQLAATQGASDGKDGLSEKAIRDQMDSMIRSKMRISSITSSPDHVFIATRGLEGYGYDVWRMSPDFGDGEVIVTGLRGCCGQMDVQCSPKGLFVAENSRDRVVHFDVDGNEIKHWGKSDRTGINGFTSCCNPMNVCFDSAGDVYTAESSSGRIKRFSSEGKLVDFIGDVDLIPGCKNVSIAVSTVNENIYMLDLTRNHIKMMQVRTGKVRLTSGGRSRLGNC